MVSQVVETLFRLNLGAAGGVALALLLRRPVRRLFGAEIGYALWLVAALAIATAFLPARLVEAAPSAVHGYLVVGADDRSVLTLWGLGAAAAVGLLLARQRTFLRRERAGEAGPAVVGLIAPRFVTPADYERRFTEEERRIIRAHERTHLERGDAAVNAGIALLQVVCWFNPLVHVGARLARQDQELACDARVLKRSRIPPRRYAKALLKAQLAPELLPFGCHWPAPAPHPLEVRIAMLGQAAPDERRRRIGSALVACAALVAVAGGWAARPVHAAPLRAAEVLVRANQPVMQFAIYRDGPPQP